MSNFKPRACYKINLIIFVIIGSFLLLIFYSFKNSRASFEDDSDFNYNNNNSALPLTFKITSARPEQSFVNPAIKKIIYGLQWCQDENQPAVQCRKISETIKTLPPNELFEKKEIKLPANQNGDNFIQAFLILNPTVIPTNDNYARFDSLYPVFYSQKTKPVDGGELILPFPPPQKQTSRTKRATRTRPPVPTIAANNESKIVLKLNLKGFLPLPNSNPEADFRYIKVYLLDENSSSDEISEIIDTKFVALNNLEQEYSTIFQSVSNGPKRVYFEPKFYNRNFDKMDTKDMIINFINPDCTNKNNISSLCVVNANGGIYNLPIILELSRTAPTPTPSLFPTISLNPTPKVWKW